LEAIPFPARDCQGDVPTLPSLGFVEGRGTRMWVPRLQGSARHQDAGGGGP